MMCRRVGGAKGYLIMTQSSSGMAVLFTEFPRLWRWVQA